MPFAQRARQFSPHCLCLPVAFGLPNLALSAYATPPLSLPDRAAEANLVSSYAPNMAVAAGSVWFNAGGAVADFNNDGLPDVFLLSGGLSPDRLFLNQGDGSFEDAAMQWQLTQLHVGIGAAAADFDSDGFIDIYVTSFGNEGDSGGAPGRHKLFKNDGKSFTDVAAAAGVAFVHPTVPTGFGPAWGDYNLDGFLDLYVPCYWPQPKSGVLFKNQGDGTFANVTVAAGLFDAAVFGFQAAFADMNGNGRPDLLVAGDYGTSRYYVNNGNGTFTNFTAASGTNITVNGMGQTIGDVNNDGKFDWYVTAIWPTVVPSGNTLYLNQGGHSYVEVGQESNVHDGGWGWGTVAVDLDNDGWMELAEVNGRPVGGSWANDPPRLFYNNADGSFTNIAVEAGLIHGEQGRGIVRIDTDRNGRQDLIVMNFNQPLRFYRNETAGAGNWIGISFDTSNNPLLPPNGYGAHVTVAAAANTFIRYLNGEPSYLSTGELNVHFGLGNAENIATIQIRWPRGYVTTLHDVDVNQYLHVEGPALADLTADGSVGVPDLLHLLERWGPITSALDLHADLDNDGSVGVADLLILLANWG